MLNCFCVGMGGFIGASARYLLSLIPIQGKSGFPWTTLFINAAGAFLIGCISAFAAKRGIGSSSLILFLKTGVCGGFTTFSTFALESYVLMERRSFGNLYGCKCVDMSRGSDAGTENNLKYFYKGEDRDEQRISY